MKCHEAEFGVLDLKTDEPLGLTVGYIVRSRTNTADWIYSRLGYKMGLLKKNKTGGSKQGVESGTKQGVERVSK